MVGFYEHQNEVIESLLEADAILDSAESGLTMADGGDHAQPTSEIIVASRLVKLRSVEREGVCGGKWGA